MLNSRYRLFYGALIVAGGLITALLFRKPFDTGSLSNVTSHSSSFTELGPAAPIASTLPEFKIEKSPVADDPKNNTFNNGFKTFNPIDRDKKYDIPELARQFPSQDDDWERSDGSSRTKVIPINSESSNSPAPDSFASTRSSSAITTLKPIETTPVTAAPVAPAIKPSQNFSPSAAAPWPKLPNDPLSATIPPIPGSTNQASCQDDLVHWSPNRLGLDQPRADSLAPKVTSSQDPFQQANFINGAPQQTNNPQNGLAPPLATQTAQQSFVTGALAAPNSSNLLNNRSMPFAPAPLPGSNMMRHVIKDGDTLPLLAQHYYGDARRAEEIFAINRDALHNPELLPLGTTLQIPGSITSQPFIAPTITNDQLGAVTTPGQQAPIPQPFSQNSQPNMLPSSMSNPGNFIRPISTVSQPPPVDSFPRQGISPPTTYSNNSANLNATTQVNSFNHPNSITSLAPGGQPNAFGTNVSQNPFTDSPQPSSNQQSALNQPGWPPQSTMSQSFAGWPPNSARTTPENSFTNGMKSFGENVWQGSASAMNWVGNAVLGSSTTAPASIEKTYIVRAGDSWETLANRFYGDKAQAMKLFQANSNRLNGMIALRPGMVIEVPPK